MSSGSTCAGDSGSLKMFSGNAETGEGGDISVYVGDSGTGAGGHLSLIGGNTTGDGSIGGMISLTGGNGGNGTYGKGGAGGAIAIVAGAGAGGYDNAGGKGGDITIDGGGGGSGATNGELFLGMASYQVTLGPVDHSKKVQVNGLLSANTLRVGGGAIITKHSSTKTITIDPPSILPGGLWYQDLAVSSAELGDIVIASYSQPVSSAVVTCSVLQSAMIRINIFNPGVGAESLDLSAGEFRVTVIQYSS